MRSLSLVAVASTIAIACSVAGANVQGSGKRRTERRTVPAFTGLTVSGALEVQVSVGGSRAVEVAGDDNIVPLIVTRVVGDTLVVESTEGYSSKAPIVVRITTPSLGALSSSGACHGQVKGIDGRRFSANVSGAGAFELSGKTDQLSIEVSGAGAVHARRLRGRTVSASGAGAGSIEVTATESLAAQVAGASTIDYWGNPGAVARDVSGVGRIRAH